MLSRMVRHGSHTMLYHCDSIVNVITSRARTHRDRRGGQARLHRLFEGLRYVANLFLMER